MPSEKFAEYLAKEAEVLTFLGSVFGSAGENHVRLSYAASYPKLEEALNRMEKAVRSYSRLLLQVFCTFFKFVEKFWAKIS